MDLTEDRDPIVEAGTTPLPYVQVGMVLRPLSAESWPEPQRRQTWEVTDVYEANVCHTRIRLLMRDTNVAIVRSSESVRAEWMLAEDFDPNGCPECGCTSVPCGCEEQA